LTKVEIESEQQFNSRDGQLFLPFPEIPDIARIAFDPCRIGDQCGISTKTQVLLFDKSRRIEGSSGSGDVLRNPRIGSADSAGGLAGIEPRFPRG